MKKLLRIRYLGMALVAALTIFVGYLLIPTIRAAVGVTVSKPSAEYVVRLVIVNGTTTKGLEKEVANQLRSLPDRRFDIEIVGTEKSDVEMPETFIVSRIADKSAAQLLAKRLGLNPDAVLFQPLTHNTHLVSASLILGKDFTLERFKEQIKGA
jgi:hypothetical protein